MPHLVTEPRLATSNNEAAMAPAHVCVHHFHSCEIGLYTCLLLLYKEFYFNINL